MIPLLVSHRLCAALAMAGALLASNLATAQTPCFQWDVTQPWVALQDNGYTVEMHLTRQGPDLGGTAKITSPGRTGITAPFRAVLNARVTGTLENAAIELHINGGAYRGSIEASGRIVGAEIRTSSGTTIRPAKHNSG